jgi:hypothetical protein
MRKRRFEIHLPVKHNDGRPVSDEAFHQTREELLSQFDGLTTVPHTVVGIWQHEGRRYEDELVRFTVDVEDSPERFEQIEIYIASYPVDIL